MLFVLSAPTAEIRDAFGMRGTPQRLSGGQGDAYLVDDLVMKLADDPAETRWTCELLMRLRPDGFRIAEPVATTKGEWVHRGWTASRFIPALRSLAPRWGEVIATGERFCDAAEQVRHDDDGVLAARTHRWAVADRIVWGEQTVRLGDDTADLFDQMAAEFGDALHPAELVHGDLAGNVFVDEHGAPVILDVSPYLRPRRWAGAIVVCDALMWHNADPRLADTFAGPADRGLLYRALAFRLLADDLASELTGEPPPFDHYRRALSTLR